jgi:hypothetical protein
MKETLTKSMKKKLRALSGLAYERELTGALTVLETDFARWRGGKLDAFELTDRVHAFHDGAARTLYKSYVCGEAEWNVANALHRAILTETEAGPDVVAAVARHLGFLRSQEAGSGSKHDPE